MCPTRFCIIWPLSTAPASSLENPHSPHVSTALAFLSLWFQYHRHLYTHAPVFERSPNPFSRHTLLFTETPTWMSFAQERPSSLCSLETLMIAAHNTYSFPLFCFSELRWVSHLNVSLVRWINIRWALMWFRCQGYYTVRQSESLPMAPAF